MMMHSTSSLASNADFSSSSSSSMVYPSYHISNSSGKGRNVDAVSHQHNTQPSTYPPSSIHLNNNTTSFLSNVPSSKPFVECAIQNPISNHLLSQPNSFARSMDQSSTTLFSNPATLKPLNSNVSSSTAMSNNNNNNIVTVNTAPGTVSDLYLVNPESMNQYLTGSYVSPYPYAQYAPSSIVQSNIQPMLSQPTILSQAGLMQTQLTNGNNNNNSSFVPSMTIGNGIYGYQDHPTMYADTATPSVLNPYGYIDQTYAYATQPITFTSINDSIGAGLVQGTQPVLTSAYYPNQPSFLSTMPQQLVYPSTVSTIITPSTTSNDTKDKTINGLPSTNLTSSISQFKSPIGLSTYGQGIQSLLDEQQNQINGYINSIRAKEAVSNQSLPAGQKQSNMNPMAVLQQHTYSQSFAPPSSMPINSFPSSTSILSSSAPSNVNFKIKPSRPSNHGNPHQHQNPKKKGGPKSATTTAATSSNQTIHLQSNSNKHLPQNNGMPKSGTSATTSKKANNGSRMSTKASKGSSESVQGELPTAAIAVTKSLSPDTDDSLLPSARLSPHTNASKTASEGDDNLPPTSTLIDHKDDVAGDVLNNGVTDLDGEIARALLLNDDVKQISLTRIQNLIEQAKKLDATVTEYPSLQQLFDIEKKVNQWKERAQTFINENIKNNISTKPDINEAVNILESGKELCVADLNEVNNLEQIVSNALKWQTKCEDRVISKEIDLAVQFSSDMINSFIDEGKTLPFTLPQLEELEKIKPKVPFLNEAKKILKTLDDESMPSASESRKKWSLIEWNRLNSVYEMGAALGLDDNHALFERIKGAYVRFKRWFDRLQSLKKSSNEITLDTLLELRFVTLTTCIRFQERGEIENALVVVDLVREANGVINNAKSKKREITKEELDAIWIDAETLGATNSLSIASKVEGLSKLLEYLPKSKQRNSDSSLKSGSGISMTTTSRLKSSSKHRETRLRDEVEEIDNTTDDDNDEHERKKKSKKKISGSASSPSLPNELTTPASLSSSPDMAKPKPSPSPPVPITVTVSALVSASTPITKIAEQKMDSSSTSEFPSERKITTDPSFPIKWKEEEEAGILRVFCHTLTDKFIEIDPFGHDRWYLGKVVVFDAANRSHFVLLHEAPKRLVEVLLFPHGEAWSTDFSREIDWQFTNKTFSYGRFPTADESGSNKGLDAIYAAQKVDKRRILGKYISLSPNLPLSMSSTIQIAVNPPETIVAAVEAYNPRDDLYSILLQNGHSDLLSVETGNGVAKLMRENKKYKWRRVRDTEGFESMYDESYKVPLREAALSMNNENTRSKSSYLINLERPSKKFRGSNKTVTQPSLSSLSDKSEEISTLLASSSQKEEENNMDVENQVKHDDDLTNTMDKRKRSSDISMLDENEDINVASLVRIKYRDVLRSYLENSCNMSIDEAAKVSRDLELRIYHAHSFKDEDEDEENSCRLNDYKTMMNDLKNKTQEEITRIYGLTSNNAVLEEQ